MLSKDQNKVFIVDFGLATEFYNKEGEHFEDSEEKVSFKGTISYASENAHNFKVTLIYSQLFF